MQSKSHRAVVMAGGLAAIAVYAAMAAPSASAARAVARPLQDASVTGCLQKGPKDTYTITSQDGKKYDLTSKTVALKNHVGHTVTVTGAAGATPTSMEVSKMDMVSTSCKT